MCSTLNFKSRFSWCLFRWIKRDCNVAAHAAAKLSLNAQKKKKKKTCFNKGKKKKILWFINGHKSKGNTWCIQVIIHVSFFNLNCDMKSRFPSLKLTSSHYFSSRMGCLKICNNLCLINTPNPILSFWKTRK